MLFQFIYIYIDDSQIRGDIRNSYSLLFEFDSSATLSLHKLDVVFTVLIKTEYPGNKNNTNYFLDVSLKKCEYYFHNFFHLKVPLCVKSQYVICELTVCTAETNSCVYATQ